MTQHLPPARLVRTTHTEDGSSVFASDEIVAPFSPFGPQATSFSIFDKRDFVPVSNAEHPQPGPNVLPRCPPSGVMFAISDFPPNYSTPVMHRTTSLDYATVLSGEIVLKLDSGEEKTVRPGEFIVQGGVNHEWHNRADVPCRLLFVMVASQPVVLKNGTVLEETSFKSVAK